MNSSNHAYVDAFEDLYDRSSIDKVIDLRRVFGPRPDPNQQVRRPPRIGVGEVTSSARRDVGALELIARLRSQVGRGRPGGLAWYTPTGLVRYAVIAPDQSRIMWQGNIGRIPGLANIPQNQRGAVAERWVRRQITRLTAQRFRRLPPNHRGADLQPAPLRRGPGPRGVRGTLGRQNRFDEFNGALDDEPFNEYEEFSAGIRGI